jgi:hypothetical protein
MAARAVFRGLVGAVALRIYGLLNSVYFRDPAMLRLAFPQCFDEFDIHQLRNILPYTTYLLLELLIEIGITRLEACEVLQRLIACRDSMFGRLFATNSAIAPSPSR